MEMGCCLVSGAIVVPLGSQMCPHLLVIQLKRASSFIWEQYGDVTGNTSVSRKKITLSGMSDLGQGELCSLQRYQYQGYNLLDLIGNGGFAKYKVTGLVIGQGTS